MYLKNITTLLYPIASLLLLAGAAPAAASCASASCSLVTGTQEGMPGEGRGTIDLSYRFIPMDQAQRGSEAVNEALVVGIDFAEGVIEPAHHRELRTNNEIIQLDINYGLSPRLALAVSLPLINNRRHEHDVLHEDGDEEFTNQDDSSGFGDARVQLKYVVAQTLKHLFIAGAGIKAPTGEYKLRNSRGGVNEPTIMPGTGSWDGLLSAFYSYQIFPHQFTFFASGSYQLNTENGMDYRFGDTVLANGGLGYRLTPRLVGNLQINARLSDRDRYRDQDVPNTGGTWVYLTPGATLDVGAATSLYAHLQLPVYQYVNDGNLVPRYGLMLGVSHNFE